MNHKSKVRVVVILDSYYFTKIKIQLQNKGNNTLSLQTEEREIQISHIHDDIGTSIFQTHFDEIYVDSNLRLRDVISVLGNTQNLKDLIYIQKNAVQLKNVNLLSYDDFVTNVLEISDSAERRSLQWIEETSVINFDLDTVAMLLESSSMGIGIFFPQISLLYTNKFFHHIFANYYLAENNNEDATIIFNHLKSKKNRNISISKQNQKYEILLMTEKGYKKSYFMYIRYERLNNVDAFIITLFEEFRNYDFENLLMKYAVNESLVSILGGIMHTFKNIMTTIDVQSRVLRKKIKNSLNLETIIQNIDFVNSILLNMNNLFTHPEIPLEKIDLTKAIELKLPLYRAILGRKFTVAFHNLLSQPTYILASHVKLEEIVLNLLINARDAMESGGIITIRLFEKLSDIKDSMPTNLLSQSFSSHDILDTEGFAIISIEDEGCGIAEADQSKIFEIFYTTKSDQNGTGLGLNIVEKYVTEMYGKIFLASEKNVGTTFCLVFPTIF